MSSNYLYIYTYKQYQKKGLIKVGQSKDPEKRITKTGNPEKPIKLIEPLKLPNNYKDTDIHKELEKQGHTKIRKNGGTEWFKAEVDDVIRAYNSVTKGHSRSKSFQLRAEQKKAVEKATKWFKKAFPLKHTVQLLIKIDF